MADFRENSVWLIALGWVLMAACQPAEPASPSARPNLIFILADDLGWADVGFNGAQYYETPNLDRMAGAGVQFSQAYANAANCAPTRGSILSGQYTARHGILTVGASDRGDQRAQRLMPVPSREFLDTATYSMADMLGDAGYHSAFIGKWHIGDHEALSPLAHGFDYTVGSWKRGSPQSYFSPYQNPALEDGPEGEQLTDRLTDEAMRYLDDRKKSDQPFFLYLSYYGVHTPLQTKAELEAKYAAKTPVVTGRDNPTYAGMIESLDQNVGRLRSYLEAEGLLENTILVFWSDNGGSWRATVNDPLKGAKGMPYEGGLRVPAFVYAPAFFEARKTDEPVISTDVYATFMHWAGGETPPSYPLDGADLGPLLTGEPGPDRSLFWYQPVYLPGSDGLAFRMCPSAVIRKGDHKLIWWYAEAQPALYDLGTDPAETTNLAAQRPALQDSLWRELRAWHEATRAAVPGERNPRFEPSYADSAYQALRL